MSLISWMTRLKISLIDERLYNWITMESHKVQEYALDKWFAVSLTGLILREGGKYILGEERVEVLEELSQRVTDWLSVLCTVGLMTVNI